jgi:hypothetical protein
MDEHTPRHTGGRLIWPTAALLKAYAARNTGYVLFQPDDMPEAHWTFILEALAFTEKACEEVSSMPAGPPD